MCRMKFKFKTSFKRTAHYKPHRIDYWSNLTGKRVTVGAVEISAHYFFICKNRPTRHSYLSNMSDQTNAVFVSIETSDHIVCTVNILFLFSLHSTLNFRQPFLGFLYVYLLIPSKNDKDDCFIQLGLSQAFISPSYE